MSCYIVDDSKSNIKIENYDIPKELTKIKEPGLLDKYLNNIFAILSNCSDGSTSIQLIKKCKGGSSNDHYYAGMQKDIQSANEFAVNEVLPVVIDAINVMDIVWQILYIMATTTLQALYIRNDLKEAINDFCDNFKDKK